MSSTLFPKISGRMTDVVDAIKRNLPPEAQEQPLPFDGSVKLHGAHADIVYDITTADIEAPTRRNESRSSEDAIADGLSKLSVSPNNFRIQSRNRTELTQETDCYGMATWLLSQAPAIAVMKKRYLERFVSLNPETPIDTSQPLIIAGEWIGHGVQKRVGVSYLKRCFVILCASINEKWLPDEPYSDICDERARIYNVHAYSPRYACVLDLRDPVACIENMQKTTDEVDKECPFAKSFGINKGMGEGIVWKVATPIGRSDTRYWMKTKGERHSPQVAKGKWKDAEAQKMTDKAKASEFVKEHVHEFRLNQGMDYLREMCVVPDKKATKTFVSWVRGDVLKEEGKAMEEAGLSKGTVDSEVTIVASRWYVDKINKAEAG